MKFKRLIIFGLATLVLSLSSACGGSSAPVDDSGGRQQVSFETVDRSQFSGISPAAEPVNLVIRNAADWTSVWLAHKSNLVPPPPVPAIDFNTRMIIGIVRYGSNGCFGAEIKKIEKTDTEISVDVEFAVPDPGLICTAVLTAPSHFVALPASQLPVRFVERRITPK